MGWATTGIAIPPNMHCSRLHELAYPLALKGFILLCCWHLWKRRNANVFIGELPPPATPHNSTMQGRLLVVGSTSPPPHTHTSEDRWRLGVPSLVCNYVVAPIYPPCPKCACFVMIFDTFCKTFLSAMAERSMESLSGDPAPARNQLKNKEPMDK